MSSYLLPYSAGTISLENGSKVVTGAGTAFALLKPGDWMWGPDGKPYTVSTAERTNTTFELTKAYEGARVSGVSYEIHRGPGWSDVASVSTRVSDLIEGVQRGYAMTSLSPVEIGTGEKTLIVNTALSILPGARLLVASRANPTTHWMSGIVTEFSGTTLKIEVASGDFAGSGSRSDWNINLAGVPAGMQGPEGPPGPEAPAGKSVAMAMIFG